MSEEELEEETKTELIREILDKYRMFGCSSYAPSEQELEQYSVRELRKENMKLIHGEIGPLGLDDLLKRPISYKDRVRLKIESEALSYQMF